MVTISSRQNKIVAHLRALGRDGAYRKKCGEFLGVGEKLLREALASKAQIGAILWREAPLPGFEGAASVQYIVPEALADFVSPQANSPGPFFTVKVPERKPPEKIDRALVLENVQDPGNVGTALRSAAAFGFDCVFLLGECADVYNPKTVRATMGAIFKVAVLTPELDVLLRILQRQELPLYGACAGAGATDLRRFREPRAAVAIGNEGAGLSARLLRHCAGRLAVPMEPGTESLNAAVAASVIMWELYRGE
ncbi:MAG: RNA methyltransferase [Oscillospiraceae bacterium]|jgi:TrmH family RNA methyltransferase|nr:RNA methyltransferase [Oscillospiraceae bacterium]